MASITERVRKALGGTATPGAAELALAAVTAAITDGLLAEGEVRLARFGAFRLRERAPRRLLLPGSSAPMQLPRRKAISFTPSPGTDIPTPLTTLHAPISEPSS